MRLKRVCYLFAASVILAACAARTALNAPPPSCAPPQAMRAGWEASFVAGCVDRNGKFAGGSQIIHLVAHKGSLYGATGYWKDRRNRWYGGTDPGAGWGQVLRLAGPGEAWRVDFDLGPGHLRTELLASLTFTRDSDGNKLPAPDTVLIASTYQGGAVSVFARDDETGIWTRSIVAGDTGRRGEDNSVRAAAVYRDRVTGREHVFISVGTLGIFSGDRDPRAPGGIRWAAAPESAPTTTRTLSIVEADDTLYASEGARIYRRVDGTVPRWDVVLDLTAESAVQTDRAAFQSIGGIRGLSAIAGPVPGRKSLIFAWTSGKASRACIERLDPGPNGAFVRVRETCLANEVSRYLGGVPVYFTLGAYNRFMPVRDPGTGELLHLIGLEAYIPAASSAGPSLQLTARNQRRETGGFYAGGLYALRDEAGRWRIGEVGGRFEPGQPELVSVYTAALSPFAADSGRAIYLGGYDPNDFPSSNTAWVARAGLGTLLGR